MPLKHALGARWLAAQLALLSLYFLAWLGYVATWFFGFEKVSEIRTL